MRKKGIVLRALVGAGLLSSFIWFCWFQKNAGGYSSVTKNGVTHVVAGSSPVVAFLSVLGILLFAVLMTREVRVETFQPASMRRRCIAFLCDCWFLLLTVVGMSSLLHLLFEAQHSGIFRWRYEQKTAAGPDVADTATGPGMNLMVTHSSTELRQTFHFNPIAPSVSSNRHLSLKRSLPGQYLPKVVNCGSRIS